MFTRNIWTSQTKTCFGKFVSYRGQVCGKNVTTPGTKVPIHRDVTDIYPIADVYAEDCDLAVILRNSGVFGLQEAYFHHKTPHTNT